MTNAPVCINDFQRLAKQNLSDTVYNYFSCGSLNDVTLKDNLKAFDS